MTSDFIDPLHLDSISSGYALFDSQETSLYDILSHIPGDTVLSILKESDNQLDQPSDWENGNWFADAFANRI